MVHEAVIAGKIVAPVGKGQDKGSSASQNGGHLPKGRPILGKMFQHLRADDLRKGIRSKGEMSGVGSHKEAPPLAVLQRPKSRKG